MRDRTMTQIGTVKQQYDDGTVQVAVRRASACEGCHKSGEGCTACSLLTVGARAHLVTARNEIGASVGDRVRLEADDRRLLLDAVLVFLFPLLLTFGGYALGALFFERAALRVAAAAGGFAFAFVIVALTGERLARRRRAVSVAEILPPSSDGQGEDHDSEKGGGVA